MCGNVTIPYPFGIGANCAINPWYIIDCVASTPYLPALNNMKVFGVDLENRTIIVSTPRVTDCQSPILNSSEIMGVDLDGSPFWFSDTQNIFVFEGCGIATLMNNGSSVLATCYTTCRGIILSDKDNCFGTGCCKTDIDISYYIKSYGISLTGMEEEDAGCGSAFLVDETSYDEGRFSITNTSVIPVSLMWALTRSDQLTCYGNNREAYEIDMFNGTSVEIWSCYSYSQLEGNPYLIDGCIYNRDYGTSCYIEDDPQHKCRRCRDSGGTCKWDRIYTVDSSIFSENFNCHHENKISMGVILGLPIFSSSNMKASAMEEGRVMSIFDAVVIKEGTRDELLTAANLAMRCLNLNGKHRPTMREVAIELETIRSSHIPSVVQTSPVVYKEKLSIPSKFQTTASPDGEELLMLSYGESSSTIWSINDKG
ncbi:hypothetical protein QVD17_37390 [Tagetes erecta]|uniref:Wall-associated receptor kinase galacturonan-binding domain-containing protein n=1 Tax=Tagetes erecta TaxID=13708 RepID=A0AAD8JWD0_TARER|nr:hypothetical protein QVD17_37390 [Tagetes erecta]